MTEPSTVRHSSSGLRHLRRAYSMQLPDEAISYQYLYALAPAAEEWTPAAELRAEHLLSQAKLKELTERLLKVRSQITTERELKQVPHEMLPLEAGFIDLPQQLLDQSRKLGDVSPLNKILARAKTMRDKVDRVIVLGVGGSYLGAKALFDALRPVYHNELAAKDRPGIPRIYFEGNNADNDALHDLLE